MYPRGHTRRRYRYEANALYSILFSGYLQYTITGYTIFNVNDSACVPSDRFSLQEDMHLVQVIDFYTAYRPLLIGMAKEGQGTGALIGAANRIIRANEIKGKVEKPCLVFWQNSQQFEAADNVQQCVKVNVETTYEYFVVFAGTLRAIFGQDIILQIQPPSKTPHRGYICTRRRKRSAYVS